MQPDSIKKFSLLYLGGLALNLVNIVLVFIMGQVAAAGMGIGTLIFGILFGVGIAVGLWYLVIHLRIELVKWVMLAFLALGLLGIPALLADGLQLTDVLALAVSAIQAAAIYFLFQPDAKAWFAEKNGPTNHK